MLRLEPRQQASSTMRWLTPILAVAITMVMGGFLFAVMGQDPFQAIQIIFLDPFFHETFGPYSRSQLLIKAGPLILIATGLSIGFRAGVWNIGAEGQFVMGAIAGGAVGLALYPADGIWVLPLMTIAGALGGMAWAMIPALLKIKFNANEILVSLMLVYVAYNFLAAMVTGPLKSPDGFGFPESRSFTAVDSTHLPMVYEPLGMHAGVLVALAVVIAAYVMMERHLLGFQIRLTGESPRAAKFAGVNPALIVAVTLGISGALAGMAGLFEVTGPAGKLTTNFPVGYGFTAIIVAFLGRLNPIGIVLAGLLMALTYIGGELAQLSLGIPAAAINVFQGMMLFFLLAVDVFVNYRLVWKKEVR
ncbi:MAG: ABC transporter permease [Paracoccaceae bacterium]